MKYKVFTSSFKNTINAASKKLLLALIPFSLFLSPIFSQGTWTSRDTLPYDSNAMQQGISGFSIGNYGYVGLGNNNNGKYPIDLWQFNPSTNSWAIKAAFPGSARVAPASFVIGDKAYLVTGSKSNGGACVNECWEYDATNNTWTQKANFPGPVRTYAVGFAIDSLGYVGTGANELSDFYKDFYAYHPSTNTWIRIADFGGIARDADCGFDVNGKGYVCFGRDSTGKVYKDIWEYDPGSNTWTQKTDNPYPTNAAVGFVICNNIYVGNGDSTDGFVGHCGFWKYNTVSDLWTREANFPGTITIQGAAFAIGDTGYCGFGADSSSLIENGFNKFYGGDSCNESTGYNTISNLTDISVYPNPSNAVFTIQMNKEELKMKTVEVYNVLGEKVFSQLAIDNYQLSINLSGQPAGMYFITILGNNVNYSCKIIKM